MDMQAGVARDDRYAFNGTFVKDWVLARKFGRQWSDRRQRWHDRELGLHKDTTEKASAFSVHLNK